MRSLPMKMLSDPFKTTEENSPTDLFYADLTGTFDVNNNGVDGEREDYGRVDEGGMDAQWDVLVGRIPSYTEERGGEGPSRTDAILDKIIRYEREQDIRWRYRFVVTSFNKHLPDEVFDPWGMEYVIAGGFGEGGGDRGEDGTDFGGRLVNLVDTDNPDIIDAVRPGGIRIGGHGNTTFCGGLVTEQVIARFENDRPTVLQLGGCVVAHPEMANNLTFALLRQGAIGAYGGTRSVTSYTTWLPGPRVGDAPRMREFHERALLEGCSQGYALWETYADIARWTEGHVSATMLFINLYGDPSVRPFPYGPTPPYALTATPTHGLRLDATDTDPAPARYTLTNQMDHTLRLHVTADCDWLVIEDDKLTLEPGQQRTLTVQIDTDRIDGGGPHRGSFRIVGDAGIDKTRVVEVILPGRPPAPPSGNQPPQLASQQPVSLPPARVGDINWMADLSDAVRDPEGGRVRFSAVETPAWIIVHPNGTLQTPYGAPPEAVGSCTMTVLARDAYGVATEVRVEVRVEAD